MNRKSSQSKLGTASKGTLIATLVSDRTRRRLVLVALAILHDRDAAEDAVQDVLSRRTITMPGFSLLKEWVRRRCLDDFRGPRRLRPLEEIAETVADPIPGHDPVEATRRREVCRRVRQAVMCLPETQREVIELKLQGYSLREMAEVLSCSQKTAERRLGLAYKNLRETLPRTREDEDS